MNGHFIYLMIFKAFCIGLVLCIIPQICLADTSAVNDPARVDEAIERSAADRRFSYPEGRMPKPDEPLGFEMNDQEKAAETPPEADREIVFGKLNVLKIWANIITYMLIGVAAIVLAFIICYLFRLYRPVARLKRADGDEAAGIGYEDLSQSGHLTLAEKLIREGKFREALSAMMMALLLALDSRRIIRYHRSRTNREYLTRLKPNPILYSVAGEFMHHFEQMKYGRRMPDSDNLTYLFDLYRQAENALPPPPEEPITL